MQGFFVSVSSKSRAINVFPKHSEIKSTWPIKSSKEEINLSRDSKELFEQHFVKVFDQIRSKWRHEIKEQVAQLVLLYHGRTVRSSHWRCWIRNLFLSAISTGNTVLESIFKKSADLYTCNFIKKRPHHRCLLWVLQNF